MVSRLQTVTFLLLTIFLTVHSLVIAKTLLVPMIIAIFLWQLLNTGASLIKNSAILGRYIPDSVCLLLSVCILVLVIYKLAEIITNNVNDVIQTAPRYQENLMHILNNFGSKFKLRAIAYVNDVITHLSFRSILVNIYAVFTTITSNALIIFLYVGFLFLEQRVMRFKLKALFSDRKNLALANSIISQIVSDTQTYVSIKTVMSILTALISWSLMKLVGLDFAEFWALLIFFLNFIPNFGPIIATLFPTVISFIQFQHSWWPFAIVACGISLTQFMVGNVIEPKYLARSLNLSPLVILISLVIWGTLWGVIGLFLSVPITVMMMIFFAHFEKTKGIAILLSENGQIEKAPARVC